MRRFLADNGLSVFFLAIFAGTVLAQSLAGQRALNAEQGQHGEARLSWWAYVTSPDFGGAVMENWQSEFLQFALFIGVTVWLVQRGSAESKSPDDRGPGGSQEQLLGPSAPAGAPRWAKAEGLRARVYENSLLLVMSAIFFATWLAQSLNNWRRFNVEQEEHRQEPIAWGQYLLNADFWERTLQNWQSEFLAVGTMVIFTVFLRQRGSPESKPVGAPHDETVSNG